MIFHFLEKSASNSERLTNLLRELLIVAFYVVLGVQAYC